MRIGSALEALDMLAVEMQQLPRREKYMAYGAASTLIIRLRAIVKARGLSAGIINAQLLKVELSIESLAGLGGGRASDDQQLADIQAALEVLRGPDSFGYHLDAVE